MKVFVAGATGVLGRRAVAYLIEAGHEVTAVARGEEKAAQLRAMGADPVSVDLFDADAVRSAVAGHDAVVNLATKIPPLRKMTMPGAWDENDRIRTHASRHLADAAIATGADVFVQESIAFLYDGHGDEWIDEDASHMETDHTEPLRSAEAAAASVAAAGSRGVVLRFGRFMAPDSDQIALVVNAARVGVFMEPGRGDTFIPLIHVDDAADAVVAALDAPSGVYHVVDDDPRPRRDHVAALARAVGRRRLVRPPAFLGRLMGGRVQQLYRSQRPSNQRFKAATGWRPAHRDAVATYEAITTDLGVPKRLPGLARLALAVLAVSGLSVGAQALADPRAFYTDFPFGRGWVAVDGPFNLHLLRDFAALNIGIGGLALVALLARSRVLTRAAGGVWLAFAVPHFLYHLNHTDLYDGVDLVANIATLGGVVLMAAVATAVPIASPVVTPRFRRPRAAPAGDRPAANGGRSHRQTTPDPAGSA
ncbi:MAG TPA: NAD-dependent epimerase/dehydratase family protein [Acidimicrobiia bacterium]|nr:NAD-dependent epimerase/dehydratase family protein [Acidimicrobiia bacterium]